MRTERLPHLPLPESPFLPVILPFGLALAIATEAHGRVAITNNDRERDYVETVHPLRSAAR